MDWFIFTLGIVVSSIVTVAVLLVGQKEERMLTAPDDSGRAQT